jgi:hypothetical protein
MASLKNICKLISMSFAIGLTGGGSKAKGLTAYSLVALKPLRLLILS